MNIKILKKVVLTGIAVLIGLWVAATGFALFMKREPADLKTKILDRKIESYLVSWLRSNEAEITQLRKAGKFDYITGGPGLGPVRLPFDWSVLGFDPELAQVRVIGEPGKDWVALLFRRNARDGIVVMRANDFGLPPKRIVSSKGMLAVYFDSRSGD